MRTRIVGVEGVLADHSATCPRIVFREIIMEMTLMTMTNNKWSFYFEQLFCL